MEPVIEINGKWLNAAQTMAVRVAIGAFLLDLQEPDALGSDKHGKKMAKAYRNRLSEVLLLMEGK